MHFSEAYYGLFLFSSSFSSPHLGYSIMICVLYYFIIKALLKINKPNGLNPLNVLEIMVTCILHRVGSSVQPKSCIHFVRATTGHCVKKRNGDGG